MTGLRCCFGLLCSPQTVAQFKMARILVALPTELRVTQAQDLLQHLRNHGAVKCVLSHGSQLHQHIEDAVDDSTEWYSWKKVLQLYSDSLMHKAQS